ncbi:MAG: lipopolysaccharide biosynthesis protein, partial [Clostridia bacterium]
VWRKESVFFRQAFSMLQRKKVARTYRHFPLYSFPQTLLNAISQNVPPFLFMQSYGASVVGGYALALRLIEMPLSLISQSFSQVYYQQASKAYHQGESLYEKLKRTTATLALIGTIPCLVIVALGPILFATLLGAEWEKAGEYARWMVLWLFFGFLNTPSVATAQIFGLQRMMFWYELALFAARTSVLIVGIYTTDAVTSVALYSVTGGLFNLLLILFILFYGKHKVGKDTSAHVSASSDKENV